LDPSRLSVYRRGRDEITGDKQQSEQTNDKTSREKYEQTTEEREEKKKDYFYSFVLYFIGTMGVDASTAGCRLHPSIRSISHVPK
jgi:hypothetical protein